MSTKLNFAKLNLQDALDFAILIEEEAKEQYEEFVRQLGSGYEGDASTLFKFMAENEAKHGRELQEKRKKLFGLNPKMVSRSMIDEFHGIEAPDYDQARIFMSPMQALEVALSCEVKAYHFFNEALKIVTDDGVKNLFSELMKEEIEHQNLIKELIKKTKGDLNPDVDQEDVDEPQGL